jgi:cation transport ATPase
MSIPTIIPAPTTYSLLYSELVGLSSFLSILRPFYYYYYNLLNKIKINMDSLKEFGTGGAMVLGGIAYL